MQLGYLRFSVWLHVLLGLILLECISCDCRFPRKKFPNGRYVYNSRKDAKNIKAPELYVLKFRCFSGYVRIGPAFIQCIDEEWTDVVPTCKRMECSEPTNVANSKYRIFGDTPGLFTIGTLAMYSCVEGYELSDSASSNLVCDLDIENNIAVWKGKVPFCQEKVSCPDPKVSEHGRREGKCCFSGTSLHFSCLEDYEIVGSEEITCLSTGNWSSKRPLCKPLEIHCELPPDIPHGVVTGDKTGDYFLPFDEAEILCKPGYKYIGDSEFVMCTEEGEWEDEFGECIEIFCDPPEPLLNGTIQELLETNLTSFPYDFEITYTCDEGYRLLGGDSWRFCDKKGWSGNTPHCEEIRCPDPGTPEQGEREGGNFKVGAKVRFRCFSGYDLIGSIERFCMSNGQWSGVLTRCDMPGNYCPNPGIPINGFKSGSNYDMGDKVGFRCQSGYIHLGSEIRECLWNKTWSGTETKCVGRYDFDNSAQISEFLKAKVAEKFDKQNKERKRYEQAAMFGRSLDLRYQGRLILHFAFDASGSIKEHNFRKGIDFAKAIVKKVGISKDGARAGALVFSSKSENAFLPMNLETTERVFEELDNIQYLGGGTSANSALELIKKNIKLEDNWIDIKNKKDVVFIITDGKANMGGRPEVEAKVLKDGGVDIYCIGITGDLRIDTLYKIASTSKYGTEERPNVFVLENYNTLSWLVQEITNGTSDYSQCGLGMESILNEDRGRIIDGKNSTEPWPWMAALFFLPRGAKELEEAELKCGGSIIRENLILTAAHCMYGADWKAKELYRRDGKEIIVKLGLKDVTDETKVQDFGVKKIHIHERYRPGKITERLFDYDVAILELDRSIEYSPSIRPICLPEKVLPEKTPLYSPKEAGWAIGFGHKDIVNPNDQNVHYTISQNLKEIRLPIQANERCIKSMEDHNYDKSLFTDRMFCAGDGRRGNDTCSGDSGGPLMQIQMNSDNYLYWTQVGIVSWGIGCGIENTYGYYAHVQNLRSWIDGKINQINSAEPEYDI